MGRYLAIAERAKLGIASKFTHIVSTVRPVAIKHSRRRNCSGLPDLKAVLARAVWRLIRPARVVR